MLGKELCNHGRIYSNKQGEKVAKPEEPGIFWT